MQDLRESRGGDTLLFECLTQRDLITLCLSLHAQFITFEGKASANRIVQLFLIVLGNAQ